VNTLKNKNIPQQLLQLAWAIRFPEVSREKMVLYFNDINYIIDAEKQNP